MGFADLPEDILRKIMSDHFRKSTFIQHVYLAGVCRSWRSAVLGFLNRRSLCRPGLLIASTKSYLHPRRCDPTRCNSGPPHKFLPLTSAAAPAMSSSSRRKKPRGKIIRHVGWHNVDPGYFDVTDMIGTTNDDDSIHCVAASSDGWLVLLRPHPLKLRLLNPVTAAAVDLPSLWHPAAFSSFKPDDIHKVILSSSTNSSCWEQHDSYTTSLPNHRYVFVFFSCTTPQLGWCKVGDTSGGGRGTREGGWKFFVHHRIFPDLPDDACFKGGSTLYVLVRESVYILALTAATGLISPAVAVRAVVPFSPSMTRPQAKAKTFRRLCHVVDDDVDDQLYVVLLDERSSSYHKEPIRVQAYKLQLRRPPPPPSSVDNDSDTSNYYCWEAVRSLKGRAMFLGYHQSSFCVPARGRDGVMGGRIYIAFSGCNDHYYHMPDNYNKYNEYWYLLRNECGVFDFAKAKYQRLVGGGGYYKCEEHNYLWFFPNPK